MVGPNDIPDMEKALSQRGIAVAELCRRGGIAETTWGRWKNKSVSPTFRSWDSIAAAFADLTGPGSIAK